MANFRNIISVTLDDDREQPIHVEVGYEAYLGDAGVGQFGIVVEINSITRWGMECDCSKDQLEYITLECEEDAAFYLNS